MLDIKLIRSDASRIQRMCDARKVAADVSLLATIDAQRLALQSEAEALRNEANKIAAAVGVATGVEREKLIREGAKLKAELKTKEDALGEQNETFRKLLLAIPNTFANDTPSENAEVEVFGVRPKYDAHSKDHIKLGEVLGLDLGAGARVAGSGFPLMRGPLALLESGVLRFAYDRAISAGFTPVNVPLLAKQSILEGLGFNPRRNDEGSEIFSTMHDDLCLVGTAEIPLVGQYSGLTLESESLPLRLVAMTPCFRREGAYGRRDSGLYRNKMFNKVELVVIAPEDESESLLSEILEFEKSVFRELNLHFRVLRIGASDLGAPAFKKYDIEGWMVGHGDDGEIAGWGELTSCSSCTDYQARRLNIRHKRGKSKPVLVHTLNGTGITSRALIPLMEQNQTAGGAIVVPPALRPYMSGRERIEPLTGDM